jgi:hypothetical protein
MLKILTLVTLVTVATLLLVFSFGETATAQKTGKRDLGNYGGTCPIGTCAKNGGPKAKDVKYCAASNCPKK